MYAVAVDPMPVTCMTGAVLYAGLNAILTDTKFVTNDPVPDWMTGWARRVAPSVRFTTPASETIDPDHVSAGTILPVPLETRRPPPNPDNSGPSGVSS